MPFRAFSQVQRPHFCSHWVCNCLCVRSEWVHLCHLCVVWNLGHQLSQPSKQTMWARYGILVPSDTFWCPNSGASVLRLGCPDLSVTFARLWPARVQLFSSRILGCSLISTVWRPWNLQSAACAETTFLARPGCEHFICLEIKLSVQMPGKGRELLDCQGQFTCMWNGVEITQQYLPAFIKGPCANCHCDRYSVCVAAFKHNSTLQTWEACG